MVMGRETATKISVEGEIARRRTEYSCDCCEEDIEPDQWSFAINGLDERLWVCHDCITSAKDELDNINSEGKS